MSGYSGRGSGDDPSESCAGYRDRYTDEFECGYETTIMCKECKYGPCGRKDPQAKCNQLQDWQT